MRRIMAVIISISLLFTLSSSVLADRYNEYMEIRIGLIFGTDDINEIRLTSKGGFNICEGESNDYSYRFSMLEDELVFTKNGITDFEINGNFYIAENGEVAIKPAYGIIGVNGKEYRGFICLKRIKDSDITVVNIVGLEEYLFSVVGAEMSPSWNIEALKAQAVCARTYAKTSLNKFKKYGFDLCTTQNSQVYVGIKGESESTIKACLSTAGQSVRYEGVPVPVYYFSSGGGSTEDSINVWGGSFSYLKGVIDPYEKASEATRYNWTSTITVGELEQRLIKQGYDIGDIISIEVTKRSETGRVTEMVISGTKGNKSATMDSVRRLIGSDLIYSQQFDISYEIPEGMINLFELDINNNLNATGNSDDAQEIFKTDEKNMIPLDDNIIITINGHGWGHAVGMSQWGAKAMADQGKNYIDILSFYFDGVDIY